ncbi:MAG TPA: hypothetical protein VK446_16700 [Methylocystis sp.]|nr:hypothetical protein [Methylocystis sp.]
MLRKVVMFLAAALALAGTPALAGVGSGTLACNEYSVSLKSEELTPGTTYGVSYSFTLTPTGGGTPITIANAINPAFTAKTKVQTFSTGLLPLSLTANYAAAGTVSLLSTSGQKLFTAPITFSPSSVSCAAPPPPKCQASTSNASNFNGTPINAGSYVWFNANFSAQGVPATGATLTFTGSSISLAGVTLPTPGAVITFSPTATCVSTTFDSLNNRYVTTAPIGGSDEIFLTGLSVQAPQTIQVNGNVTWNGTFGSDTPGVSASWKWGAAVYTSPCFTTNPNAILPLAAHGDACVGNSGGDHAGTPEGVSPTTGQALKACVIGGARGGGGSNWTGSWSGTVNVTPVCQ